MPGLGTVRPDSVLCLVLDPGEGSSCSDASIIEWFSGRFIIPFLSWCLSSSELYDLYSLEQGLFEQKAGAGIPDFWSVWKEILGRNWGWVSGTVEFTSPEFGVYQ